MKTKLCLHLVLFSLCFSALSLTVFAQKFEISPYAAYNSNNIWGNINSLRSSGMFGVKGGVFVNRNVEVEGNFGVLNHFEFETSATQARGVLWEGSTSYNFFPKEISAVRQDRSHSGAHVVAFD